MSKMNPTTLMKLMAARKQFEQNHPKFGSFLKAAFGNGIPVGTIIEISVERPGEPKITSNLRVQQSDLELLEGLKEL